MRMSIDKTRYDGGATSVEFEKIGSRAHRSAQVVIGADEDDPAPVRGHRSVTQDAEISKRRPKPRAITAQRRELPDVANDEIGLREFVAHIQG